MKTGDRVAGSPSASMVGDDASARTLSERRLTIRHEGMPNRIPGPSLTRGLATFNTRINNVWTNRSMKRIRLPTLSPFPPEEACGLLPSMARSMSRSMTMGMMVCYVT